MILIQGLTKVLESGIVNYLYIMKKTIKKSVKKYGTGGTNNTRPVQNAPKVSINPPKPVSKAEAPKTTPKPTPKPAPKSAAKTPAKSAPKAPAKTGYSATKDITSRMVPKTGVPKPGVGVRATTKPKPTPAKSAPAKTVSQLWTEKTGTPWSEAKKQGFTDGSTAQNIALMKKLKSGSPMEYTRAYTGPDYSGDAAAEAAYGEPKTTMRKGGRVKSKRR